MHFQKFLELAGRLSHFDFPALLKLTGEKKYSLQTHLRRWVADGRVVSLRRGLYTVAESFRRGPLSVPGLADVIYGPSYLSAEWALIHYGLIPGEAGEYTSVTSRTPRLFQNPLGTFRYRHVKHELLAAFSRCDVSGGEAFLAEPEKAILDFLYFSEGEWNADRHREMGWQNLELLRGTRWRGLLQLYSDRIRHAADLLVKP